MKAILPLFAKVGIYPVHNASSPPIRPQLIKPINRITSEMWKDYRAFEAAGMLAGWRTKWAAYLPQNG